MDACLEFVFRLNGLGGGQEVIRRRVVDKAGRPFPVVIIQWDNQDAWYVNPRDELLLTVRKDNGDVLFKDYVARDDSSVCGWAVKGSNSRLFDVLIVQADGPHDDRVIGAKIRLDTHPSTVQWAREVEQLQLQSELEGMRLQ